MKRSQWFPNPRQVRNVYRNDLEPCSALGTVREELRCYREKQELQILCVCVEVRYLTSDPDSRQ